MDDVMAELDGMSLEELIALRLKIEEIEIVEDASQDEFEVEMMILEDVNHPRYVELMAKYS